MDFLIREMEKITAAFWKPVGQVMVYETPAERIVPCRKHFYNAATSIVLQPTAQPAFRRGPDDYVPVNLNHRWDELECEGCYWDKQLTGMIACRMCSLVKVRNKDSVVCNECIKKYK